jgi:hypothetical protein
MTINLSRRGFLKGLAGVAVIAALPAIPSEPAPASPPVDVLNAAKPPEGVTYQWVRTHLLGVPEIENVEARINNGWTFVAPRDQPHLPVADAELAVENGGLILMQKPTALVDADRLAQYKANLEKALKR